MSVDKAYAKQMLELLRSSGQVEGRAMFGGFGIWERGVMFALLDSDSVLYFKTDTASEVEFREEESTQFAPQVGNKPPMPMPYWSVPASVLDDQEVLETWAKRSISIAHATAKKPSPKPAAKKAPAKAVKKPAAKPAKKPAAKPAVRAAKKPIKKPATKAKK